MISYRPFRLEIPIWLRLETFHVGTGQQLSLASDSPILRDENDAPYLPASSLRGLLRAHLEREAPLLGCTQSNIDALFGHAPTRNSDDEEDEDGNGAAVAGGNALSAIGRLQVSDSRLRVPAATHPTEVRDHVRVNPKTGAAQHKGKFDAEASTGDHLLDCTLVYEGESPQDTELLLVHEALRALENGELHCGAKSGWGYGRLWAPQIRYHAFDRTTPTGLAAFCAQRLEAQQPEPAPLFKWPPPKPHSLPVDPDLPAWSWLELYLDLAFEGPALVRAPIPPTGSKTTRIDASKHQLYPEKGLVTADQLFIQTGSPGRYYLPGSSLRGVLRGQANRIANTMGRQTPFDTLFGTINEKDGTGRKSLIEAGDGFLEGDPKPVYLDHVAIDRITGFAADSKKFSTCALQSPCFRTRLRVRFSRTDLSAVALFGFVLRDLCEGWLWVGGGVTRGFGHLPQVKIQYLALNCTSEFTIPGSLLPDVKRLPFPGRTRLATSGPIEFYSLHWLWTEAEAAWNAIPAKGAA